MWLGQEIFETRLEKTVRWYLFDYSGQVQSVLAMKCREWIKKQYENWKSARNEKAIQK